MSWLGWSWLHGKKINLPRIEIFVFPISAGWNGRMGELSEKGSSKMVVANKNKQPSIG